MFFCTWACFFALFFAAFKDAFDVKCLFSRAKVLVLKMLGVVLFEVMLCCSNWMHSPREESALQPVLGGHRASERKVSLRGARLDPEAQWTYPSDGLHPTTAMASNPKLSLFWGGYSHVNSRHHVTHSG